MEKNRQIKKFITKTAIKIVIFVVVMILVAGLLHSISPIMTNQIALGQMQNSDEAFVFMNTYNNVKPVANLVLTLVCVWFGYTIIHDVYKFIKNISNIEKGEN